MRLCRRCRRFRPPCNRRAAQLRLRRRSRKADSNSRHEGGAVIDPRFYEVLGPLKASDIAALLGSTVARGDPARAVTSVASASTAQASDLTFLEEPGDHT